MGISEGLHQPRGKGRKRYSLISLTPTETRYSAQPDISTDSDTNCYLPGKVSADIQIPDSIPGKFPEMVKEITLSSLS